MITPAELLAARILIVDDREPNVLLLEAMLQRAGYAAVSRTTNPREVCDLHREHRFDLILLDLQMPQMDGFQVMEALKEVVGDAYLPVLVITAQPGHKLRALKAGARDFITKPFEHGEVLMRVQNLLEARLQQKALEVYGQRLEARNQFIRKAFGRYLSDEIVESLLASPEALALGGARRVVTMMMADLRGYTPIAEGLPPEKVVSMVNNFLEKMIEVLVAHGGTMNDFTGDGFFALFGAPVGHPDDAVRAVACALAMQRAMAEVNDRNRALGLPVLEMGIGLNTGEVVVGNIGSVQHAKYGVVGSAVNLTARIESYSTGGQVMISPSTFDAVRGEVVIDEQLRVEPKGVSRSVALYSVVGLRGRPELVLPHIETRLAAPPVPLAVRFAVMEGNHARGEVAEGRVTGLSRRNVEIESSDGAPAFANLKLKFVHDGAEIAGDLYAKVSGGGASPGVFLVRFTSLPPAMEAFLEAHGAAP